jgi:hypothetical protein
MKIQYEIKGITLDVRDLMDIHQYYEAACTAEYIMENYGITDEREAMQIGYNVRFAMDKYGYDEETAINEVLRKEN